MTVTKPNFVVARPITGWGRVTAYEGWDRANRRRVVIHRHRDDSSARREFHALEKAETCDRGLVVGGAFHRLCFDSDVDFGPFAEAAPEPAHPSVVLQTCPGARRSMRIERRARGDAEIAAAARPAFAAVAELHAKTPLVHLAIRPGNLACMWSGRCTLTDLHAATEIGVALDEPGSGVYACPDAGPAHPGMDMWSLGVLLYRLAHPSLTAHPFGEREGTAAAEVLWRNPAAPKAAALCAALLAPDPEARPSASEALRNGLFC